MPKLVAIDTSKLASAIGRADDKATIRHGVVMTEAQQRLSYEYGRKGSLQAGLAEIDAQNTDLERQIGQLQALLEKGRANSRDARIELKGVLQSINVMEMEGLVLPPAAEE